MQTGNDFWGYGVKDVYVKHFECYKAHTDDIGKYKNEHNFQWKMQQLDNMNGYGVYCLHTFESSYHGQIYFKIEVENWINVITKTRGLIDIGIFGAIANTAASHSRMAQILLWNSSLGKPLYFLPPANLDFVIKLVRDQISEYCQ